MSLFHSLFRTSFRRAAGTALASLLLASGNALAAETSQTLSLSYGWNAIWLEVEPRDTNGLLKTASEVFASTNFVVDKVAVRIDPASTDEFSTDPAQLFNQDGWNVWSRSPGSGQSAEISAVGNKAYLLYVTANSGIATNGNPAGTLTVEGEVRFNRPNWSRGNYNLAGFPVTGSPTFASLFRDAPFSFDATPAGSPIQRLNPATGGWEGVGQNDVVEPGRAYWISVPYNLVSPTYAGPIAIDFPGAEFGGYDIGFNGADSTAAFPNGSTNFILLNSDEFTFSHFGTTGNHSNTVTLTKLTSAGDQDLRLFRLERITNTLAWTTDAGGSISEITAAALKPGETKTITLGLDRNWSTSPNYREHLYRISVSLEGGSIYFYLPVSAADPDMVIDNQPVSEPEKFAGLWIGSVMIDKAGTLDGTNGPLNDARSPAPLQVLIHVNTNGEPVLLSHVMLMQTKTADATVAPEQVLVLDESQIPFYEGIEERGGTKIGVRYETIAFDMPRDNTVGVQSNAFLQAVATENGYTNISQVTDEDVSEYLATKDTRPTSLKEVYHLSWPLEGTFGPGNNIYTSPEMPLRLDAFHRTNPYRHAYHTQHGAGFDITRRIRIQIDGRYQSGSGWLMGTYEEITSGLANSALVARGPIKLSRVSFVTELR